MAPRLPDGRTALALVLVGLLVVTAGCGDGGGDGGTDATTTAIDTTVADAGDGSDGGGGGGDGGATATPTPTTTVAAPADGPNPNGDPLSGAQLEAATAERLRSVDSFTAEVNLTLSNGQDRVFFVGEAAVDNAADRGYSRIRARVAAESVTTTYTADGVTYQRRVEVDPRTNETTTEYRTAEAPYDGSGPSPIDANGTTDGYADYVESATWERVGTERFDGTRVVRYEVTGVANRSRLPGVFGSNENRLESISGVALVTEDGVVRSFEMRYTFLDQEGREATFRLSQDLTAFGETSVEAPDWLDEARSGGS